MELCEPVLHERASDGETHLLPPLAKAQVPTDKALARTQRSLHKGRGCSLANPIYFRPGGTHLLQNAPTEVSHQL